MLDRIGWSGWLVACYGLLVAMPTGLVAAHGDSIRTRSLADDVASAADEEAPITVLFFGDSLTAGYGLPPEQGFPALIQERIDKLGWEVRVVNAGLSGETSAGGLRRIAWHLRAPIDVLVLALGANDALRGLPPSTTKENLDGIIATVRDVYPDVSVLLAGMLAPPNLGVEYSTEFREIFPEVAETHAAALIPFLLAGVAARPELSLGDGIHPNAAGQRIVAETVWGFLEPFLRPRL